MDMSAAAPPINLWAMMAAAGANMPYVGFGAPLAILSVVGAVFSMFWLAGRSKAIGPAKRCSFPMSTERPVSALWK